MKLSQKRVMFTSMVARLILHAETLGYRFAGDDLKRQKTCSHGHKRSTHRSGLALDGILYTEDWKVVRSRESFNKLHDYWDSIGGSERINGDLGHFSLEHNGVR